MRRPHAFGWAFLRDLCWFDVEAWKTVVVMLRLMFFVDAIELYRLAERYAPYEGHGWFAWALAMGRTHRFELLSR